jgi:hypothetical protein
MACPRGAAELAGAVLAELASPAVHHHFSANRRRELHGVFLCAIIPVTASCPIRDLVLDQRIGCPRRGGAMLNGHDQRAWEDLEGRLRGDGTASFLPVPIPLALRWTSPRWLPCAMAVIVPLLLPTLSVFEMRPFAARTGAVVAVTLALPHWAARRARGSSRSGIGPTRGH